MSCFVLFWPVFWSFTSPGHNHVIISDMTVENPRGTVTPWRRECTSAVSLFIRNSRGGGNSVDGVTVPHCLRIFTDVGFAHNSRYFSGNQSCRRRGTHLVLVLSHTLSLRNYGSKFNNLFFYAVPKA